MDLDDSLISKARQSLRLATDYSFDKLNADGHWCAEVFTNDTITAEYVFLHQALGLSLSTDRDALRHWLLSKQNLDGSWGIAPDYQGDASTTAEVYLALKILNVPVDCPAMYLAREFMLKIGGIAKVRFFTRFFLASFGLFPWDAVPQLPPELILMPPTFPVNIYALSSWARSTLVPLLLLRHHQPIYALPNGGSADFLDELWCNPANKHVPYAPPLLDLLWNGDMTTFFFTTLDRLIYYLGGLRHFPLRGSHQPRHCLRPLRRSGVV